MKEFKGDFGIWEFFMVCIGIFFSALFFIYCWNLYFLGGKKEFTLFSVTMLASLCLFIVALPAISKKAEKILNGKFEEFLALPDKTSTITYPVISQFLGEQALGGFIGSAMMLSARTVMDYFGAGVAGIYCFIILMIAIAIASISLMRFILHFTKFKWHIYIPASLSSLFTMLCFLAVGLKSVTP